MSTTTKQVGYHHSNPAIIIGDNRATALRTVSLLEDTPYHIAAVLDTTESAEAHRYSALNLGTLLHTLHPRPRVLITGTAVASIVPEVQRVWEEYVESVLMPEGGMLRALFVPLSEFQPEDDQPLRGTAEYLMEKLDAVFRQQPGKDDPQPTFPSLSPVDSRPMWTSLSPLKTS